MNDFVFSGGSLNLSGNKQRIQHIYKYILREREREWLVYVLTVASYHVWLFKYMCVVCLCVCVRFCFPFSVSLIYFCFGEWGVHHNSQQLDLSEWNSADPLASFQTDLEAPTSNFGRESGNALLLIKDSNCPCRRIQNLPARIWDSPFSHMFADFLFGDSWLGCVVTTSSLNTIVGTK